MTDKQGRILRAQVNRLYRKGEISREVRDELLKHLKARSE